MIVKHLSKKELVEQLDLIVSKLPTDKTYLLHLVSFDPKHGYINLAVLEEEHYKRY